MKPEAVTYQKVLHPYQELAMGPDAFSSEEQAELEPAQISPLPMDEPLEMPEDIGELSKLANQLFEAGNYEQAVGRYEKILNIYGKRWESWFRYNICNTYIENIQKLELGGFYDMILQAVNLLLEQADTPEEIHMGKRTICLESCHVVSKYNNNMAIHLNSFVGSKREYLDYFQKIDQMLKIICLLEQMIDSTDPENKKEEEVKGKILEVGIRLCNNALYISRLISDNEIIRNGLSSAQREYSSQITRLTQEKRSEFQEVFFKIYPEKRRDYLKMEHKFELERAKKVGNAGLIIMGVGLVLCLNFTKEGLLTGGVTILCGGVLWIASKITKWKLLH